MPISSLEDIWDLVCDECKKLITETAFNCFLKDLKPLSFINGEFTVSCNDEYAREIIEENYSGVLSKALKSVMGIEVKVLVVYEDEEEKIITMTKGMIGFPHLNHFALIFDEKKGEKKFKIMWLQSLDDGTVAFPVIDPTLIVEGYTPSVNEEILAPIGELNDKNTYVLVTVTVPKNVEEFSANLKAPIVINMDTNKGAQVITEDDYPVKYKIYELLKATKEKAGE